MLLEDKQIFGLKLRAFSFFDFTKTLFLLFFVYYYFTKIVNDIKLIPVFKMTTIITTMAFDFDTNSFKQLNKLYLYENETKTSFEIF